MRECLKLRNIAGGVLAGCGVLLILQREADTGDRVGFLLLGFAVLILGVIVLSGSLTGLFSRPLTGLIDQIYFGDNDRETPPVNLKLARVYRGERRYDDAIAECERQLEYHPRSVELWTEMIRSAGESGDREAARKYLRRAKRRAAGDDRVRLVQEFERL